MLPSSNLTYPSAGARASMMRSMDGESQWTVTSKRLGLLSCSLLCTQCLPGTRCVLNKYLLS